MVWVLLLLVAVAVVAVTAALAAGRLPLDAMSDPVHTVHDDGPWPGLPTRPVAGDVDGVHFDRALRGYRMDQVDTVLDALRDRLAEHERALAGREPDPPLAAREPDPPLGVRDADLSSPALPPRHRPERQD